MRFFSATNLRLIGIYLLIVIFACLPIWAVDNYINQDGSAHLYNAFLIIELLRQNPVFTEIYALSSAPIPNLSGHFILAFLMLLFKPFVVTKIMVTFTFAGLAASVGWLRLQTVGREGLSTTFLIGSAFAFNWMWFLGFYNFIIGVIGFAFTLGLFWRWRENLNLWRSLILSVLFIFVFYSHLISFAMLIGSVLVIAAAVAPPNLKRALFWTFAAILPTLPFVIGYKLTTETGGAVSPIWRFLQNPLSPSNWVMQLQTADPFQLLTRKGLPFVSASSNLFAVFSPFVWIITALLCLAAATWLYHRQSPFLTRQTIPFILITIGSIFVWIFAPDDFGKSHGGFLRERVLLCGLICFVPLFRAEKFSRFARTSICLLLFVIFFQTFALWEYALNADALSKEYLAARPEVGNDVSFGAIKFIENGCRYKANPLSNLNAVYGIGRQTRIWDNYEIGYYHFPVMAKNIQDRQFSFDFHEAGSFELCDPNENVEDKLNRLNALMNLNYNRVDVLLIWNGKERPMPFLNQWYESTPFYESGRVQLFRRR